MVLMTRPRLGRKMKGKTKKREGTGREQQRRHGSLRYTKTRTRRDGISSGRACLPPSFKLYIDATSSNSISTTGASEYKLNNKVVTYNAYALALTSHNILIKARNFLVFQGDVEAVASQSPQALSRLIAHISGSLELKGEYDKCREAMEKATERATENFGKRRGIAGEIKTYKEQKGEAEKFEGLVQERVRLISSIFFVYPKFECYSPVM